MAFGRRAPSEDDEMEEEEGAPTGACGNYRVDVTAARFGDCTCGFPKSAHLVAPKPPGRAGGGVGICKPVSGGKAAVEAKAAAVNATEARETAALQLELVALAKETAALTERRRVVRDEIATLQAADHPPLAALAAQKAQLESEAEVLRGEIDVLSAEATCSARASTQSLLKRLSSMGSMRHVGGLGGMGSSGKLQLPPR